MIYMCSKCIHTLQVAKQVLEILVCIGTAEHSWLREEIRISKPQDCNAISKLRISIYIFLSHEMGQECHHYASRQIGQVISLW